MSEEQIIEQIARDLCAHEGGCARCNANIGFECQAKKYAKLVYEADYKKEIHGRWHAASKKNGEYGWYCSICGAGFLGENAEWIAKEHKFCPKCGATMN